MFRSWFSRSRPAYSPPRAATRDEVEAQLDVFFDELLELTRSSRVRDDLDRTVADACARIEEWTARPVRRSGRYSST